MRSIREVAREAAITLARADLAKQLETRVQTMVDLVAREGQADGKDLSEEMITEVSREVAAKTLIGTRVAATQVIDNEIYALVCLDLDSIEDAFTSSSKLSDKARENLRKRADDAFKDLDQQVQKLHDL
jgi:hypothetical protein